MKKILFSAYDMNLGGIETSLLTLLNFLVNKGYDITLVLEKKQGIFIEKLDERIDIIEYKHCENKNIFIRKIVNLFNRLKFIVKYKNKFDFSASYATYSKVASFTARTASKNNALWGHADYMQLYNNNIDCVKKFFKDIKYNKFKKIVFVSKKACNSFIQLFPEMQKRTIYCNNLIEYKKIEELSKNEIEIKKEIIYTFVNVGRHDEKQKKLTRIIEASKMLKKDNLQFRVLFIGTGQDEKLYKELVDKYNLQDKIMFLGAKQNPYPYIKLADAVILTSDYEGYPVVFLEALVLNKPIITTDISDAKEDIENKFGNVVKCDIKAIYLKMKEFIQNGYSIKNKFDAKQYNDKIANTIENIINE